MKRSLDENGEEPKSKSQFKREAQGFDDLGKELVSLSERQVSKMQMPDHVKTAVLAGQTMQREAYRRQLQFIGKLLRKIDTTEILAELARIQNRSVETNAFFQSIERWRDRLIATDEELFEQLIVDYPHTDRQQLHQLIRNAQKETSLEKSSGASKALFRYLRELTEFTPDEDDN
ncbi:MAG: ribosome biogenesis factor YjgA [Gammaproteobacteria bacterium]|nr:ribosome biogenesis factor YjgA [Gammaproteobacteria bacterium]